MNMFPTTSDLSNLPEEVHGEIRSYPEFREWMDELVANKKTSGVNQSEAMVDFTALNQRRMKRLDKTVKLSEELIRETKNIKGQNQWWVITEAWCGDSAQTLPIINKIAEQSEGKISLRIVMRDENLPLMDHYRTNRSLSIPKLVAFDSFGQQVFVWGPRPEPAQQLLKKWKADPQGRSWEDFETELHTWYAKDKTKTTMSELTELIGQIR
jgi:hypothetical protein